MYEYICPVCFRVLHSSHQDAMFKMALDHLAEHIIENRDKGGGD